MDKGINSHNKSHRHKRTWGVLGAVGLAVNLCAYDLHFPGNPLHQSF